MDWLNNRTATRRLLSRKEREEKDAYGNMVGDGYDALFSACVEGTITD
jgi:hypothetical protein